jgi:hypothetical protein
MGLQPFDINPNSATFCARRMAYVRYADDFVIGLANNKTTALQIKNQITEFLQEELHLSLNAEKTLITDISPTKHRALKNHYGKFLGYKIQMHPGIGRGPITRTGPYQRRRLTGKGHVILKVDKDLVFKRLSEKGFCKKDGTPIPKFTFLSDTQATTNEKINRIMRGMINYYKLADNKILFGCHLFHIMSFSLAKMYAAKFR